MMLFVMYVKSSGRRETTSFITSAAFSLTRADSETEVSTLTYLLLGNLQTLDRERGEKDRPLRSSLAMSPSTLLLLSSSRRRTKWTTLYLLLLN